MNLAKLRILAWSERSEPLEVYPEGINGDIAAFLNQRGDIEARTAQLSDPGQGLSTEVLEETDVLTWWGHQKHGELRDDVVQRVVRRVREDGMGFVPIHSSHFSKPFMALNGTPCGLGGWREEGEWEDIEVVLPNHPIAKGISNFRLPHTEMYKEPFTISEPEDVVFRSTFEGGEWFRSGVTFTFGKGRVFYFRPGHETYRIMADDNVQRIIYNGVLWVAGRT
jgi:trehalose utilization protein